MKNDNVDQATGVADPADRQWEDDPSLDLPEWIGVERSSGLLPPELRRHAVALGFRRWPDGAEVRVRARLDDTLGEVFTRGAAALGEPLLPPSGADPLDILRSRLRRQRGWSEPLSDFDRPLWLVLVDARSRRFAIEYVLAIKINTQWAVAPRHQMTPRELLLHFGFDPSEFTLYRADSASHLPPDTPIDLARGDRFEAQKDGRYGASRLQGSQTIEEDVALLREAGTRARLLTEGGQRYVEVEALEVPERRWPAPTATLLVAVPATYPAGGLDAFYVELCDAWARIAIPRQQAVTTISGRAWALISWHYTSRRPWNPSQDNLASHLTHCRGFFLNRGVCE